jgi:excisionase family DNA binding protein
LEIRYLKKEISHGEKFDSLTPWGVVSRFFLPEGLSLFLTRSTCPILPYDTLNVSTSETLTQDKVTIQQASVILNIGRKTIYRWIDKGLLSKTKEGKNAYVSMSEVRALCDRSDTQVDTLRDTHKDTNTATVDVSYLEGLLVRLGQLEAEKRYLLEYKTGLEEKDKELTQIRADAEQKAQVVLDQQAALEARERELEALRAENERLKRLKWWERLFSRK